MLFGPHQSFNTPVVRVKVRISVGNKVRGSVLAGTCPIDPEKRRFWSVSDDDAVQKVHSPATLYRVYLVRDTNTCGLCVYRRKDGLVP